METKVKPGRYFPKGGRRTTGRKIAQKPPVQTVSVVENRQAVMTGAPTPTETQSQIANRLFRERIAKIPDTQVTIREGENQWEPIFLILVPEFRSEAARQVYKLRGDLYRKYPAAILNVEVRGKRELGECPVDVPFLIS